MVDAPDLIKKVTEALNAKGVRGSCPMCQQNEWMIQESAPYSRIDATDAAMYEHKIYKGFMPSYWLYCGNCGFVAQFMKSIVDGEGEPEPERPQNERQ